MDYYEDIIQLSIGNGKVKCILCDEHIVDNNDSIKSHLNGDLHMELYIKRIMISNNIVIQQKKASCLLCKIDVHNLDTHIQSTLHQQRLDEIRLLIAKDGNFLDLPSKVKENKPLVHCIICDSDTEFTLKGIADHMLSANHKRVRSMAVQPINGIFTVDGTDDLWCKICQICFENYIEIIFEHVDDDKKHTETLSKIHRLIAGQNITIDKYLTDPCEDKAKCHKCNIEVPCNQDNIERHVKGKKHKNTKT